MGNTGSLFSAVAEVYLGEPRSALARVRDDMPLVLRQGNDYLVLFIGQIAAAALADLGQTAVAATIHGRTSTAPIDPGIADRLNTALGISAGDDNYEALINEGAALSVDALVELTLGTINDMLGSTP